MSTPNSLTRSDALAGPGWRTLGRVTTHTVNDHEVLLGCESATVQLRAERMDIVRVRLAPEGVFGRDHSWAVVANDTPWTWRVHETDAALHMANESVRVRVDRDACRVTFLSPEGEFIVADEPARGMCWDAPAVACWKTLSPADHFFGFGEKGMPLDKRGQSLVNWNTDDFDHGSWTDPLYQAHPFLICVNEGGAYGLLFDNTYRSWFDLGKTSRDVYGFGADGGEMNYYFIPGPTVRDVLHRHAALVGTAALPPRWSLGYQQCRWSYESDKRIREVARQFRKRRIPCDTLYLDIDYMDGYRCFTWNRKTFPKPAKLMKDLAKDGFNVVAIVDPGIKVDEAYDAYKTGRAGDHFCHDADGKPYVGKVWPGESVFPDFTRAATRKWWGEQYRTLTDAGVRGFWNDMNEPADFVHVDKTIPLSVRFDGDGKPTDHREAHNVYGMQMARASFEGLARQRKSERPFVLTRAGYSGVQRFAAVWTGDNASAWDHLAMSVPMMLNLGLSGVALCGADIGGFRGVPSAELYTRWLQLGIFYPLCRTHTAGGPEQDPWSYGKRHERINRRAIELRYQLLPYLYTEMRHAEQTGEPVMRPLLLDCPDMPNVHKMQREFLFGRQLLIAPVLDAGATVRRVALPLGEWYGFEPGADRPARKYRGELAPEEIAGIRTGRMNAVEVEVKAPLDTIPMLARGGAIIPTRDVVQHSGERPLTELTLDLFPGNGVGAFYDDDGISFDYHNGAFAVEHYEQHTAGGSRTFLIQCREGREEFLPRKYVLRFQGIVAAPQDVLLNGAPLRKSGKAHRTSRAKKRTMRHGGWSFGKKSATVIVRLDRPPAGTRVEIIIGVDAPI